MKKYLLFITILILVSCNKANYYEIHVFFDNVSGLNKKTKVVSKGLKIGEIKRMKLFHRKVLVTLSINNDVKIGADSKIIVLQEGLLGGKILNLETQISDRILKHQDTLFDNVVRYEPEQHLY